MFSGLLLFLFIFMTLPLFARGSVRALPFSSVSGLLGPGTQVEGLDLNILKAEPQRLEPLRGFIVHVGVRPVAISVPGMRDRDGFIPPPGREPVLTVYCIYVIDRDNRLVELLTVSERSRALADGNWLAQSLGLRLNFDPPSNEVVPLTQLSEEGLSQPKWPALPPGYASGRPFPGVSSPTYSSPPFQPSGAAGAPHYPHQGVGAPGGPPVDDDQAGPASWLSDWESDLDQSQKDQDTEPPVH